MKLKNINALDMQIRTEEEVKNKLIELKKLEIEMIEAFNAVKAKFDSIKKQRDELICKINKSTKETAEKAVSFENFKGVVKTTSQSWSYDNEKLFKHPQAKEFAKIKVDIDKNKLKKFVKEHGMIPGIGVVNKTTYKVEINKIISSKVLEEK